MKEGNREDPPRQPIFAPGDGAMYFLRKEVICRVVNWDFQNEEDHPLSGVEVTLEDGEALQKNVTLTRVLLLGAFALAAPKISGGTKYLIVKRPDFYWCSEIDRKIISAAVEFATFANNAAAQATPNVPTVAMTSNSGQGFDSSSLESLVKMHNAGDLSDEEFFAAKRKLLGL
jgi:hypothetical protein